MAYDASNWFYNFIDDQKHYVPDVKLTKAAVAARTRALVPMRGQVTWLAVYDEAAERYVGYINTSALGHYDVKAWIAATGWRAPARGGKARKPKRVSYGRPHQSRLDRRVLVEGKADNGAELILAAKALKKIWKS